VLSGKESDATVTGTPRAFAALLALAAGATVGKSPPGSVVGPGRNGSAAEDATPAGVRGGRPVGSVVPTPPSPAAAVGEIVVVAEMRALAEAGVAAVAPVALAVAVRVACWPVLAVFGTATVASSSSAWSAASVPTVHVAPLADRQAENRGVIAAVTLALVVTVMPLAWPPEGQTQIA
jgi:hypothetical protein